MCSMGSENLPRVPQLRQKEEWLRERDTDVVGIMDRIDDLPRLEVHAIHHGAARLLGGTSVRYCGEVVGAREASRLLYPINDIEQAAAVDFVHGAGNHPL